MVDAGAAIKCVYSEDLSPHAHAVRVGRRLVASGLAECANILWEKVRRYELAVLSAASLLGADIEGVPLVDLGASVLRLAIEFEHPAYDCFYLELCRLRNLTMVTVDDRLLRKLAQKKVPGIPMPGALAAFG